MEILNSDTPNSFVLYLFKVKQETINEVTSRFPGIYIHIPFCTRRCYYCDFATWGQNELPKALTYDNYTDLLIQEIKIVLNEARKNKDPPFSETPLSADTLYFGGGTPSLMPVPYLERIVRELHNSFDLSTLSEFTLEVNPETLSRENLSAWLALGINRLSIGVQSLKDESLLKLGRVYTRRQVLESLNANAELLAKFDISFDLLLGVAWQDESQVLSDLKELLTFEPKHFSLYGLKVEEGTPFEKLIKSLPELAPNDDRIADELIMAEELLANYGFIRYEVSNFARKDYWSRHNLKYWLMVPFWGFGLSSAGFDGRARTYNPPDFQLYQKRIMFGTPAWERIEILSNEEIAYETLILGLRTHWGVEMNCLKQLGLEIPDSNLEKLERDYTELLRLENGRLALTEKGMNVAHSVIALLYSSSVLPRS